MPPMLLRAVASLAPLLTCSVLVGTSSCASSGADSPLLRPDADRDVRVLLRVPGGDSPTRISIDGEDVCGGKASVCPGNGVLDGAAERRMTIYVSPGSHVLTIAIPTSVGGSQLDEEGRFTLEAAPEASYLCHIREGCAPMEPSDEAADEAEPSPTEAQCRLNSDCELGLQCALGACVPLCREDRDCANGQRCGPGPEGYDECLDAAPAG